LIWSIICDTCCYYRFFNPKPNKISKNRITCHVTKSDDELQRMKEDGERASVKGNTKEGVLKKAIEIAKKQGDTSVVVHKRGGKIQEEKPNPKQVTHAP